MKDYKLTAMLLLGSLMGCSAKEYNPPGENISLEGTWISCTNDAPNSQKITLIIDGENLEEIIDSYSVVDCVGTEDSSLSFTGTIEFEELRQSTFEPGATDITLNLSVDLFGCGAGNPAYTYFLITDNSGFDAPMATPACDPNNRGSGLGQRFNKVSD